MLSVYLNSGAVSQLCLVPGHLEVSPDLLSGNQMEKKFVYMLCTLRI